MRLSRCELRHHLSYEAKSLYPTEYRIFRNMEDNWEPVSKDGGQQTARDSNTIQTSGEKGTLEDLKEGGRIGSNARNGS
jgi:hypothetical protein